MIKVTPEQIEALWDKVGLGGDAAIYLETGPQMILTVLRDEKPYQHIQAIIFPDGRVEQ